MWDTPFDPSMLDSDVIIRCEERTLADTLMWVLEENGVLWRGWERPVGNTKWKPHSQGTGTYYWIRSKIMTYGSLSSASDATYDDFIRCTFYGADTVDFVTASDDEVLFLLLGK